MRTIIFSLLTCLISLHGCGSLSTTATNAISACSDQTLAELKSQNDLTDDCRSAVEALLSSAQDNLSGKIVALGGHTPTGTTTPTVYFHGRNSSGTTLTTTDYESATVVVTDSAGTETTLASSEFTVASLAGATDDLVSISVVTDYSASMRDADLDTVTLIYTDLFGAIPAIYEAEAVQFSAAVTEKQDYTADSTTILAALARDDTVTRTSTALYDGMGEALANLTARTRPIKLLIVATDGLENSSATFTKSQVTTSISTNKVVVLMIGTLFSDLDALKDLAGSNGLYFYAPSYSKIRTNMASYTEALGNLVKMTLDSTHASAASVKVTIGDDAVTFRF
jgi:uncharacterized protein YjbI with pentapeptide repeats